MKILHLFTRRMRLPVVVCCAAALHQNQSTMSNLFVKVSPTRGSTLIFVRHWSQKPKPWVYRKPVEYITPHDIFRQRLGLPPKLNQTKELQDYSDYSFHDGRPTPVRPGQLKQIKQQQSLAAAAVVHLKEIKYIVDRDTQRKQHAQNERRHIIESKLKPKRGSAHEGRIPRTTCE